MDKKATGIIAYLSWVWLLVAYFGGDREGAKFHLNQALVINLFALISIIPILGWMWGIFMCVCWFIGFIGALRGQETKIPLLGGIKIIK